MFYFFELFLLFGLLLVISLKIKNNKIRIIFHLFSSFFITLEFIAFYVSDKFIDYRFYNHINLKSLAYTGSFVKEILLFLFLLIIIFFLLSFLFKKIPISFFKSKIKFIFVIFFLFILLSIPRGVFNEIYGLISILRAKEKTFNQSLEDLGINPNEYITKGDLQAKPGKNIIVLSLESLERNFMSEFDNLTPNLKRLSEEWTFYNMKPNIGCGWTAGSLYGHQIGLPAFFKEQSNTMFKGINSVKLLGLGNVLSKAGYNSRYLIGNVQFAGKEDLLKAYEMQTVSEKNCIGKNYLKISWGLFDFDLFSEAKKQLISLKKKNKPFAFFLFTINTHPPNGLYDKRMEKLVNKRSDNFEFAVSGLDYLIGDFVKFLKEEKILEDTSIFIFPDHKLMQNTMSNNRVVSKLRQRKRELFVLTNVSENQFTRKSSEDFYQIDLPRMIIEGAKIKTNAKFFTDFIRPANLNRFLIKNRTKITSLNMSSVSRNNSNGEIKLYIKRKRLFVLCNNLKKTFQVSVRGTLFLDLRFTNDMMFLEEKSSVFDKYPLFCLDKNDYRYKNLHLIVIVENGKIKKAYFGNKHSSGIYKQGNPCTFSEKEIDLVVNSNIISESNNFITKKEKCAESILLVTSSSYTMKQKHPSLIKFNGGSFLLKRGLNLIIKNQNNKYIVENYDTFANSKDTSMFLSRMEQLIKDKKFWILASHSMIKNNYPGYKKRLQKMKFNLLPNLHYKVAYIAYQGKDGKIKEDYSDYTITYAISAY